MRIGPYCSILISTRARMKMNFKTLLPSFKIVSAIAVCLLVFVSVPAQAEIFATVHGIVHDPQHRPIQDADVVIKAQNSDWVQRQKTTDGGEFEFSAVPLGEYIVTITLANFQTSKQDIVVTSGSSPILHFQLDLAGVSESTVVNGDPIT